MELSRQELKIIDLIAHGSTNREIAAKLGIKPGTLKLIISKIFGKFGILGQKNARVRLIVKHYCKQS
ncbi:MAG: helix-turn-helix transcriptional regulator [Heliobacteriaceae bacterium]|jgi:DNA-binding NarL/FixJ family response regulator|nr:helix-turn-helix transcriptional regulator [Heliobacteriaceae bacterium]